MRRCRSIPQRPPIEEAPTWEERRAISLEEIAMRATETAVIGPGIVPKVEPRLYPPSREFAVWARTNVRPQKQDGYSIVIVTTVLGDLTSAQFRLLGELAEVYGDGTVRVTMDQNLLFRWVRNENVETLLQESRRGRVRARRARARSPTSRAALVPSRASSP